MRAPGSSVDILCLGKNEFQIKISEGDITENQHNNLYKFIDGHKLDQVQKQCFVHWSRLPSINMSEIKIKKK